MSNVFRIGGAVVDDHKDETETQEETSIRLSDDNTRVRLAHRCLTHRRERSAMEEQGRMSFPIAQLPMVIAALQSLLKDR